MDTMEKFYSDASRLVEKSHASQLAEKLNKDGDTAAFDARLTEIFCKAVLLYNKQAQVLANDFADYWLSTYSEGRQEDWEQINLIISSEAESLDMDLLNSIMAVIVERKKI